MTPELTPARILETATAFWPSKVLLSAVELGLFTELARGPRNNGSLSAALGIRADRSADFFDAPMRTRQKPSSFSTETSRATPAACRKC
jgi:hypothetical protein